MSTTVIDELIEIDDASIDDELCAVELALRKLADRQATLVSIIEARGIYRNDGHRTMAAHLRATCNWSNPVISRVRRRAALIDAAPVVGDALRDGHISICAVDLLADAYNNKRVGHLMLKVIELFTDHAEHLSLAELKIRVDQFMTVVDVDGSFDETREHIDARNAWVVETAGGVDITATGGDPLQAARMAGIFERFCNIEYQRDLDTRRAELGDDADSHELPRTPRQRRFDAMVAMIETANIALNENTVPGAGSDPVTNIIIDHESLDETFTRAGVVLPNGDILDIDGLIDTDPTGTTIDAFIAKVIADPSTLAKRHCRTAAGTPISPTIALKAAMLGRIRRVVVNSQGVVIDQGRTQRLFTHNARVAAMLLATTCTHPGCNTPAAWCDVDHADEWSRDHGETNQVNADIKCGDHDRFKHQERWRTRRSESGRPYSIRPDDTIVLPVGERPPDLSIDETNRLARRRLQALRPAS